MLNTILILIAIGALVLILHPLLLAVNGSLKKPTGSKLQDLIAQKELIYQNIHDLDLEFQMGKLTEADYHDVRKKHKIDAAHILQEIDQIQGKVNLDEWIEAEVLRRRNGQQTKPQDPPVAKTIEPISTILICPQCDHSNPIKARFCSNCGFRLETAQCPTCNTPYIVGTKFCNQCGQSLTETEGDK